MAVSIVLAGLLGLFVCLFSVPINLRFSFDSTVSPRFHLQIGWLFNAVRFGLPAEGKSRKKREKRIKKKRKPVEMRAFLELISRPLIFRFFDLARKIRRAVHLNHLHADIRAGLGDPADTGILFGAVSSISPFCRMPGGIRMHWEPDFGEEPVLEGASEGMVRLRPIALAPAVFGFLFSKPVRQGLRRGFRLWNRMK